MKRTTTPQSSLLLIALTGLLWGCQAGVNCPEGLVLNDAGHCEEEILITPSLCSEQINDLFNNNDFTACYYAGAPGTYAFSCTNVQENSAIDSTSCNATCTMQDKSRRGLKGLKIHPTHADTFSAVFLNTDGSPALEVMCTVMN